MQTRNNSEILKLLCGELQAASKASTTAAMYADEAAKDAVLASNLRVTLGSDSAKLARKLATEVAAATVSASEELAITTLETAQKAADILLKQASEVALVLKEGAATLAASLLLAAEKLRANEKAHGAAMLQIAITSELSATAAKVAAAAAAAATDKVCGHFRTVIGQADSLRN